MRKLFHSLLTEAIHKYTSTDPDMPRGETVIAIHFVNQPASDIQKKKKK